MPFEYPTFSSGSMRVVADTLADEAIAMYPATLASTYGVRVIRFLSDREQRFVVNDKLFSCILQYHGVNGYDLAILRKFFHEMGGMYVSPDLAHSFSITIDGETYDHCGFAQDELIVEFSRGETASFDVKIVQVAPNGALGTV